MYRSEAEAEGDRERMCHSEGAAKFRTMAARRNFSGSGRPDLQFVVALGGGAADGPHV